MITSTWPIHTVMVTGRKIISIKGLKKQVWCVCVILSCTGVICVMFYWSHSRITKKFRGALTRYFQNGWDLPIFRIVAQDLLNIMWVKWWNSEHRLVATRQMAIELVFFQKKTCCNHKQNIPECMCSDLGKLIFVSMMFLLMLSIFGAMLCASFTVKLGVMTANQPNKCSHASEHGFESKLLS